MEWTEFIRMLFELAEPYLAARNDLFHTRVAHQYCLELLSAEGGDKRIVEPAVILHDVGWSKLTSEEIKIAFGVRANSDEAKRLNRIHEVEGATLAGRLLQTLGYDPFLIQKITLMIERHDSGKHPESLEEIILKDSDKLWRFSDIGFWNEVERQSLDPLEMYHHLEKLCSNALFSRTALLLAEEELGVRALEISNQSDLQISASKRA